MKDLESDSMYGFLYVTVNLITGRRYIGKCSYKNTETWRTYIGSGSELLKDVKTYGRNHFFRTILKEYQTKEELNKAEKDLIELLNATEDESFYNLAKGGDNNGGMKWSEEQYKTIPDKISASYTEERRKEYSKRMKENNPNANGKSSKGRVCSEAAKQRMSEAQKGHPGMPGELNPMFGKRGVLNPNYGTIRVDKRLSELHKNHISESKTGLKNGKNVKAVVCNETNVLYESINLAAKAIGVDSAGISKAIKDKSRKSGGYHWHIATDEEIASYIKSKKSQYKEE